MIRTQTSIILITSLCFGPLLCQCTSSDQPASTNPKNGLRLYVGNQPVPATIALAAGAKCDVTVAAPADMLDAIATVTGAKSSAATKLAVVDATGNQATVQGLAAGAAQLTVAATLGYGDTLSATAAFAVRPATKLALQPGCGGSGALYATQRQVWIAAQLAGADGGPLLGYGYHPVDVAPPSQLSCDSTSTSMDHWLCQTGAQPGLVAVKSQLGADSWQLTLASDGQIDGVRVEAVAGNSSSDNLRTVRLRPTVSGEPLCGAVPAFSIAVVTPTICAAGPPSHVPNEAGLDPGLFVEFKGYSPGACQVAVTIPAGNGGAGLTQTVSLGAVQGGK